MCNQLTSCVAVHANVSARAPPLCFRADVLNVHMRVPAELVQAYPYMVTADPLPLLYAAVCSASCVLQLMSYIYTGSLQPNLPQSDLLQLLLLADRFDVARAVAAARRALASLSPECFEWITLTGVWGLPQHLYEGDGDEAAALRGVAWERLLQLFGDLEEAWASADGRAMWQQLP